MSKSIQVGPNPRLITGTVAAPVTADVSTTSTIIIGVDLVNVDGTTAPYTITIPDPADLPARGLTLTRIDTGTGTVTITTAAGTAVLDATTGATSIPLDNSTYSSVTLATQ